MAVTKDLGAVTAYAMAKEAGYTGTKAQFEELMASYATVAQQAAASASAAAGSATAAAASATAAASHTAETFSPEEPYTAGKYVVYNGGLYVFTEDKAAGSWDSTKVEAAIIGDDLSALKEDYESLGLSVVDGMLCVTYEEV